MLATKKTQVAASLGGLRAKGSSPLFHAAVDAVCELVWCTVDPRTGQVDSGMMPLIQVGGWGGSGNGGDGGNGGNGGNGGESKWGT